MISNTHQNYEHAFTQFSDSGSQPRNSSSSDLLVFFDPSDQSSLELSDFVVPLLQGHWSFASSLSVTLVLCLGVEGVESDRTELESQ